MRIVETLVLKLDELGHHDIVGETLLDAVQVLFHGCVRCRHLDHLDIVSQRRQLGQHPREVLIRELGRRRGLLISRARDRKRQQRADQEHARA